MPNNNPSGKVIQKSDNCLMFLDYYQLPPHETDKVTFELIFENEQHYYKNDDLGNVIDGWNEEIKGPLPGVKVYGDTGEVTLQNFINKLKSVYVLKHEVGE